MRVEVRKKYKIDSPPYAPVKLAWLEFRDPFIKAPLDGGALYLVRKQFK